MLIVNKLVSFVLSCCTHSQSANRAIC